MSTEIDIYAEFGIDKEEAVEASKNEGSWQPLDSGIYTARIEKVFIRKTDSGASMVELGATIIDTEDSFFWNTCIRSGDEKDNKTTYTSSNGKEVILPGVVEFDSLMAVLGIDKPSGAPCKVDFRDEEIDALCISGVQGKTIKLGIRQEENDYNGEITIRNSVHKFMTAEGEDGRGESIEEDVAKFLERNPLKKAKKSKSKNKSKSDKGSETKAPSKW